MASRLVSGVAIALAALARPATAETPKAPLVVRASEAALPCVAPALAASGAPNVRVVAGAVRQSGPADVLVGSSTEVDRALESGLAFADSDESLGEVAWVLLGSEGPVTRSLADLGASGTEVLVPAGPEADEARRLVARAGVRIRERALSDVTAAPLAVVPSWVTDAARGARLGVRPLRIRAAVSRGAADADGARAVVRRLAGEAARRAFARCAGGS
jgi:hypothetical protein